MNSSAPGKSNEQEFANNVFRLVKNIGLSDGHATDRSAINELTMAATAAEALFARLQQRIAELELLADSDELTGLLNRRGFDNQLQRVLSSVRRYNEQGLLIYIDLDGFKPVNDSHGHAAGDEVLRRVAGILRHGIRETDFAGRVGGDEFAVLLTRTNWRNGLRRAEKIEKKLNQTIVHWQGQSIAVTASFGLQGYGPKDNGHDLLRRADQAMYKTKRLRASLKNRRGRL